MHPRYFGKRLFFATLTLAAWFPTAGETFAAEGAYAISSSNDLLYFGTDTPGSVSSVVPITGLQSGERVLGMDFRPLDPLGRLYLLGSTSQLYVIDDLTTGTATAVGGSFSTPLNGTEFGFDFNPTVDRIRIVSDANQNLRLHPDTGAIASVDPDLAYAVGDGNEGADPAVVGAGYTNSFPGAPSTVLYDIDAALDILVTQNPANNGTLNTVGALGIDASGGIGFDISGVTGIAYAVASASLYTVDLGTGAASLVGGIEGTESICCLSIHGDPPPPTPVKEASWGEIKALYKR